MIKINSALCIHEFFAKMTLFTDALKRFNPESNEKILLQFLESNSALSAIVNKNINHDIWNYISQHTPHFPMKST